MCVDSRLAGLYLKSGLLRSGAERSEAGGQGKVIQAYSSGCPEQGISSLYCRANVKTSS